MPYSSASGKDFIRSLNLKATTILDVGAGSGTYRELLPNLGKHWTALEIWAPYVTKFGLTSKYDEVIVDDIRTFEFLNDYVLFYLCDILYHMSEDEAKDFLSKA